ncbi:hypothetical protein PPERSA_03372 [Pseudocohnilembus persalinus]|uniref:Uncharacterized protein n=1 Tax=Pseudocohnilembus persalinus TaxID=266149 RepID=A0A0V0R234_PSEPJ|nr:hypothetical protein PPERSA_03372 [Pseudocohnilembus persalinus]|eukprot:KRX08378.1 hypothetical protein PPERSA_03372 [Pseudocohnilembus persalinus]
MIKISQKIKKTLIINNKIANKNNRMITRKIKKPFKIQTIRARNNYYNINKKKKIQIHKMSVIRHIIMIKIYSKQKKKKKKKYQSYNNYDLNILVSQYKKDYQEYQELKPHVVDKRVIKQFILQTKDQNLNYQLYQQILKTMANLLEMNEEEQIKIGIDLSQSNPTLIEKIQKQNQQKQKEEEEKKFQQQKNQKGAWSNFINFLLEETNDDNEDEKQLQSKDKNEINQQETQQQIYQQQQQQNDQNNN